MYYLEDLTEGLVFDLGSVHVSEEEIIDFATKFDPQRFHIDKAAGEKMFGGLIASGWHTASLCQKLIVEGFLGQAAGLASPGVDALRFVRPVFAGDTLFGRMTIESARVSESKPDRGLVNAQLEMVNARDELVLSMMGSVIVARRPGSTE